MLSFEQADQRRRQHAIHGDGVAGASADRESRIGNTEADVLPRQSGQRRSETGGTGERQGRNQSRETQPKQADRSGPLQRAAINGLWLVSMSYGPITRYKTRNKNR